MSYQTIKPLYVDPTHLVPREMDSTDVVEGSYTDVAKEPSGFPNRVDSVLSFDDSTRTFSIAPVGSSFDVFVGGFKRTFLISQSIQIPVSTGLYWIYFSRDTNTLAVFSNGPSPADVILHHTPVAIVYWNSSSMKAIYFGDERHGIVMDSATHAHLHQTLGTVYRSGLSLNSMIVDGNGSLDSHAQFHSDSGRIADEDIEILVGARTSFETFYRIGTAWYSTSSSPMPLFIGSNHTLPSFNSFNGTAWSLLECVENRYILVHVVSTNDGSKPTICILGDSYQTKSQAKAAALTEFLSLSGLPFSEFVPIATVIYQCNSSYANSINARIVSTDDGGDYIDWRGTRGFVPASVDQVVLLDSNPVFTYDLDGNVTRIDYSNGNFKTLTYLNGGVQYVDYYRSGTTYRKTFNYDVNGNVISIVETIV